MGTQHWNNISTQFSSFVCTFYIHKVHFTFTLQSKVNVVRFSHTTSRKHLHFVWRIDSDDNESGMLQKKDEISSKVWQNKKRQAFNSSRNLTGDCSADSNQHESETQERIKEVLDDEDDQLIWDLRINNGRPEQYIPFLEQCQKYIAAKVETAVDERRHDPTNNTNGEVITHMAQH